MIKKIFYYFLASFDNFSKGASTNKVTAAVGLGASLYITRRFVNVDNYIYALIIWLLFVLLCLGIILFKQITELVQSYKGGNQGKTIIDEKQSLSDHMDAERIPPIPIVDQK